MYLITSSTRKWEEEEAREFGFYIVLIVRNAANKDTCNILFEQLKMKVMIYFLNLINKIYLFTYSFYFSEIIL